MGLWCNGSIYGSNPYSVGSSPTGPAIKQKEKEMEIASLVLGIVGFFFAGIPCGCLAIVFGVLFLSRTNKASDSRDPRPVSIAYAGLILGILDVVGVISFLNLF